MGENFIEKIINKEKGPIKICLFYDDDHIILCEENI